MTPEYLKKLECGNIGVALGAKSNNLVALDVDLDELVEPLITANPFLNATLQTRGARGRVFWLRMAGAYPGVTKPLQTHSGDDCGEWRAGKNSQSIIHGIHPKTGKPYQVLNMVKPVVVEFSSIIWPTEIISPPKLEAELPVTDTEEPDEAEDTDETKDTEDPEEVTAWLFSVHSIEDALRVSMPTAPHQNHRLALVLARAVKALEMQSGKPYTPQQHRDIHNQCRSATLSDCFTFSTTRISTRARTRKYATLLIFFQVKLFWDINQ